MAKIGRNQPCPCGSGHKYKKCCLVSDQAAQKRSNGPPMVSANEGGQGLSAYTIAKIFERSDVFAKMKREDPKTAGRFWTISRTAALSTSEITAELEHLGVDASPEAFCELAQGHTSAWDLSDGWRQHDRASLSRHENDFLGFAACELWKRYCPERPSVEMIDDWMEQGYTLLEQGQGTEAIELWLRVWDAIRQRLEPEMRTVRSADGVFSGCHFLFNWIQDLAMALSERVDSDFPYQEQASDFFQAVARQFPDEAELFRTPMRADFARYCFAVGRPERGERVLLELIEHFPHLSAGYITLARSLLGGAGEGLPADLPRAIALLEAAVTYPVVDGADYDLDLMLEDCRARVSNEGH